MTEPVYDMPVSEVLELVEINRTTLYRWMAADHFPKPKKIGLGKNGRVRWCRAEVEAWIAFDLDAQPVDNGPGR